MKMWIRDNLATVPSVSARRSLSEAQEDTQTQMTPPIARGTAPGACVLGMEPLAALVRGNILLLQEFSRTTRGGERPSTGIKHGSAT